MPKEFRLEVAFQSNATPAAAERPVTMAYAFTDAEPGRIVEADAQNLNLVHKRVPKGSRFYFGIFDTAIHPAGTTPPEVAAVTIDCAKADTTDGDSPFVADPDGLNSWWLNKNSITAKRDRPDACPVQPQPGQLVMSTGCNVIGRHWYVGPFNAFKEGAYEFTVTVNLDNGRTFMVDPEMVVGDGG